MRKGRTEVADGISGLAIFFGELRPAFDLVEKHGRRELEEVGEEVQAAAVRHPDNDVFHASLYQYDLSGNERRECKARCTLCRRREERIQCGEHRLPTFQPILLQIRELDISKVPI